MNPVQLPKSLTTFAITLVFALATHAEPPSQDAAVRTIADLALVRALVRDGYGDHASLAAGYLDATKPPYRADSTGHTDATAAIQQALKDARDSRLVLFLPAGRYLVSDSITGIQGSVDWGHWDAEGFSDPWLSSASFEYPNVIMGPATGGRATLVLADHSPGFGDTNHPKPVLHFWARMEYGKIDKQAPQPNINFNQKIVDVDFELGAGNPGAIAIDHQGAEGSVIEDVRIDATGAFAGIHKAPGSGGSLHGITVVGGKYGFYLRSSDRYLGSQPSPVASAIRLFDQTDYAILYDGRGPLTLVGAQIRGAGIRSEAQPEIRHNGALNLIDTVIATTANHVPLSSNHSIMLENVFLKNKETLITVGVDYALRGDDYTWYHIVRGAIAAAAPGDSIWFDEKQSTSRAFLRADHEAPTDPAALLARHDWPRPFPTWLTPRAVNVRDAPYHATGNGRTDDAGALQRAIDENETVFLPPGTYAVSRPLTLHSRSRFVGLGNVQTIITVYAGPNEFSDPDHPKPLIATDDDPAAETILAFLELRVPVRNPCVYALNWRAGRHSVVRNVYPIREPTHPDGVAMSHPLVKIEKSGGGRWFTNVLLHWWDQGPTYRHLKVDHTSEPLAFYMLEPQHARGTAMVEIDGSSNIAIYAVKSEGDVSVMRIADSSEFKIFGYAGVASPAQGGSLFEIVDCHDYLLANFDPQMKRPGNYGALGIAFDPHHWNILTASSTGEPAPLTIKGTEQFVLFQNGTPH